MSTHLSCPPEVLGRTSGEIRFSDFMLWEANHSMLVFYPKEWPDLTTFDILYSILEFQYKSSVQNLMSNFTKWTSSKNESEDQESLEKIKQFNKELEFDHDQMIIDGKGFRKEIPLFELR